MSTCPLSNHSGITNDYFSEALFGNDGLDASRIIVASIICWLITSVAVAAGIGGGGLLVPLYFITLNIDQTRAVSLSKGTIFGVAVGNFFFISREKHPTADRPLIDYPTAIFMQGGELMGVVIGVLLNLMLPQIVTIILSAIVLGFNAYKTLTKAVAKYRAETKAFARAKVTSTGDGSIESDSIDSQQFDALTPRTLSLKNARRKAVLDEQAARFPVWAWALLLGMCAFFIVQTFAIERVFDASFTNCHRGYWPVYATPFLFYGAIITYMARRNVRFGRRLHQAGVMPRAGDIRWTWSAANPNPDLNPNPNPNPDLDPNPDSDPDPDPRTRTLPHKVDMECSRDAHSSSDWGWHCSWPSRHRRWHDYRTGTATPIHGPT